MHAVVARRGPQQDRRIWLSHLGEMIGRNVLEERPVLRLVRIAVFRAPARAGEQLAVAAHVEEGDQAPDCAEALRIAREHVADEQSAVAAAIAGEAAWSCDAAANEVRCDSGEVVLRAFFLLADPRLVPGRAKLRAAADIGNDIDAAALEPGLDDAHRVGGEDGDKETAIAIEDGRRAAVERKVLWTDLEIGDAYAVVGDRLVLGHGQPRCIEARWQLLEQLWRFAGRHDAE